MKKFMDEFKYDKFYYSEDKSDEHYLSEITNLSQTEYDEKYRDKMYCPLCKTPQIGLVHRNGKIFLRKYQTQPHGNIEGEACDYSYESAPKKIVEKYVTDLRNKKKTKSLLESIMRRLFNKKSNRGSNGQIIEQASDNPFLIKSVKSESTHTYLFPRCNFNSWGEHIPENQFLIIYGKVYVELYPTKDENTYIHFKNIKSKKFITSCRKPNNLNLSEGNYCAVILGKCVLNKGKNRTYPNIVIDYSIEDSMLFEKIE